LPLIVLLVDIVGFPRWSLIGLYL